MAAVEARSLSSLVELAANPPELPTRHEQDTGETLVLYIARVPGSRDVFLTPVKPRRRVVTAQDVRSCMYYFHVDDSGDAGSEERRQPRAESLLRYNDELVRRKPVRSQTRDLSELDMNISPKPREDVNMAVLRPIENMAYVKQARPESVSSPKRWTAPSAAVSGDRPLEGGYSIENFVSKATFAHSRLLPAVHHRRSTPRDTICDVEYFESSHPSPYVGQGPSGASTVMYGRSDLGPAHTTSVTVIRRDPSSGAQCNAATIVITPELEYSAATISGSNAESSRSAPGGHIYLDVLNPGYAKFAQTANNAATLEPMPAGDGSMPDTAQDRGWSFTRRLWREEDADWVTQRHVHSRTMSQDSRSSTISMTPSSNSLARSYAESIKRSKMEKSYTFTSPWDGQCVFSTGLSGRSVRCKHRTSSALGLGVDHGASVVSELRFNLPDTRQFAQKRARNDLLSGKFGKARGGNRDSLSGRPNPLSSRFTGSGGCPLASIDSLDLSLGRELAGGGLRGRDTKLGKVILKNEGLEMLDLLVAANMSLWWRAYTKLDQNFFS